MAAGLVALLELCPHPADAYSGVGVGAGSGAGAGAGVVPFGLGVAFFCDVVLGWDSKDQLYDNVKYTGWHTVYPDAPVRLLPDTCRTLPFEDNGLFFLGEFSPPAETV